MPDPSQTLKPMLIDGQWVAQENGAFDSVNPATGARNFRISGATQAEIDAAVDAGWRAVRQAAWRDMLPHARAAPPAPPTASTPAPNCWRACR